MRGVQLRAQPDLRPWRMTTHSRTLTSATPKQRPNKRRKVDMHAASSQDLGSGELVAGIDLGTTNSCIAISRGESTAIVATPDGDRTVPSVVALLPDGGSLVGKQARRHGSRAPRDTFSSVKRFIGRSFDQAQADARKVPYEVSPDAEGRAAIRCRFAHEGVIYPEEVSARIVAELLSLAESQTGEKITKAVISVPAYFGDAQRNATMAAGRIAGLETVKLIKEPVAAALAYQVAVQGDETVMVLDLGGGTFDVSILEVGGGVVEVLSTGGAPHLGGDDWDTAIVAWLADSQFSSGGVSWREPGILGNLRNLAETAKIKLSTAKQVALKIPVGGAGGRPIETRLTRADLDRLSEPLYRRLRLPIDACCWQAGVDLQAVLQEDSGSQGNRSKRRGRNALLRPKNRAPISRVLLVGGATRMPTFQRFVQNMTGIRPDQSLVDPDLAVAIGAANHAASLSEGSGSLNGLETMDPLRRALMEALAKKQLLADEAIGREALGAEYDAFVRRERVEEESDWDDQDEIAGETEDLDPEPQERPGGA